jgi:single-strand DNA-binding protein
MGIATNRIYNDRDGNRQESTDYHNIVVFGKTAENCAKYLNKGNGVFVEGRMQTRSWEQDGQKKYRTEIVADRVQFGPKSGGASAAAPAAAATAGSTGGGENKAPAVPDYPEEEINPEDIPF